MRRYVKGRAGWHSARVPLAFVAGYCYRQAVLDLGRLPWFQRLWLEDDPLLREQQDNESSAEEPCGKRRRPSCMRVRALLVALLVLGGVHVATAAPASACSCSSLSDQEHFGNADAVFVGDLTSYSPPPRTARTSLAPAIWRFATVSVYKGTVVADQAVASAGWGASCGLELPDSGRFLVFATTDTFDPETRVKGPVLYGSLCGGTRLESERGIPASFGTPVAPHPGATQIIGPSPWQRATNVHESLVFTGLRLYWLVYETIARTLNLLRA